jgi:hypothetical protein
MKIENALESPASGCAEVFYSGGSIRWLEGMVLNYEELFDALSDGQGVIVF